jgi:hypothetical protein
MKECIKVGLVFISSICCCCAFFFRCKNEKYLLDGKCVDACPAGFTAEGSGDFGRLCLVPTTPAPAQTAFPVQRFQPRFVDGRSSMAFSFEKGFGSNMLDFQIKTTARDGLLMFSGPENSALPDFFAVAVASGRICVLCRMAAGVVHNITSSQAVSDGQWHRVRFWRTGAVLSLQIDSMSRATWNGTSIALASAPAAEATALDCDSLLEVGAVRSVASLPEPLRRMPNGIRACMDSIVFDGLELLGRHRELALVSSSRVQRCELPQFAESDHLVVGSTLLASMRESLEVRFDMLAASNADAVLFYQGTNSSSTDYFTVLMSGGRLRLSLRAAGVTQTLTTAKPIEPGTWLTVSASFTVGVSSLGMCRHHSNRKGEP